MAARHGALLPFTWPHGMAHHSHVCDLTTRRMIPVHASARRMIPVHASARRRYLAFRAFNFVLMFAVLLWSFINMAEKGDGGYWFIYLTHWTLVLEVVYLALALSVGACTRHMCVRGRLWPRCAFVCCNCVGEFGCGVRAACDPWVHLHLAVVFGYCFAERGSSSVRQCTRASVRWCVCRCHRQCRCAIHARAAGLLPRYTTHACKDMATGLPM